MKKWLLLSSLLLWLPLQACADDAKWKEGVHYKLLDKPASSSPEIVEFFSFWCPHCFSFEPLVAKIKEKMDPKVAFNKVQVNFMGYVGPDVQDDATRAMLIGRAMKQEDKVNDAVFRYIHQQRGTVTGLSDLRNVVVVNDIDGEAFDKMAASFGVNSMLKKNNQKIDDYRSDVRAVPTFIVNGRYQAVFTRDMTQEDIVDLIVWLSTQP